MIVLDNPQVLSELVSLAATKVNNHANPSRSISFESRDIKPVFLWKAPRHLLGLLIEFHHFSGIHHTSHVAMVTRETPMWFVDASCCLRKISSKRNHDGRQRMNSPSGKGPLLVCGPAPFALAVFRITATRCVPTAVISDNGNLARPIVLLDRLL
jgi:hypothetical protein